MAAWHEIKRHFSNGARPTRPLGFLWTRSMKQSWTTCVWSEHWHVSPRRLKALRHTHTSCYPGDILIGSFVVISRAWKQPCPAPSSTKLLRRLVHQNYWRS